MWPPCCHAKTTTLCAEKNASNGLERKQERTLATWDACCNHSTQVQQMEDGMHEMEWVRFYLVDHGIHNCPAIQCNGIHCNIQPSNFKMLIKFDKKGT
jgi:hypothetical protein